MIVLALNSSSSTFKFGLYWVMASQSLKFLSDAIFASSPEAVAGVVKIAGQVQCAGGGTGRCRASQRAWRTSDEPALPD